MASFGRQESEHTNRARRPRPIARRSACEIESITFALRIERRIRSRLQRLLGSQQDVSDLLQDVYLQLLIAHDKCSGAIQSPHAYVMTVVRNKAYDWLRHRRVVTTACPTVDIDDIEISAEGMRPDELVSSDEELEMLFHSINSLPLRCQEVFILRKVCGMPHKNIARAIGITVNTVEQHMRQALQLLDESLSRYGPRHSIIDAVRNSVTRRKSERNQLLDAPRNTVAHGRIPANR